MKKNDLYELVASLNAPEKKLFSEKYGKKKNENYVRLFTAITSGRVTNDTDAKKEFAGQTFINHLGKTKAYLYEVLLDTLQLPLKSHYIRLKIFDKLQQAETLLSRRLLQQAEDILMDALEMARRSEEIELEMLATNELATLYSQTHRSAEDKITIGLTHEKMVEFIQYHKFFREVLHAYTLRGTKQNKRLDEYKADPLLTGNIAPKGKKALRALEATKGLLETVSRNYDKAQEINFKLLQMHRGIDSVSARAELGYINILFNTISTLRGRSKKKNALIKELKNYEPVSRYGKVQKFVCLSRSKLTLYLEGNATSQGKQLMQWIEQELKEHQSQLNEIDLVKLHFSTAMLHLKEKKYDTAQKHLLPVINSKEAMEKRTIIFRVAMLYQLIAEYEQQNFEWLSNRLRNYNYFQKTNDAFYLIEKHTLVFLTKAISLPDKKSRNEAKKQYEQEMMHSATKELLSGLVYLQNIDWITHSR
jgi:hypothetical protein